MLPDEYPNTRYAPPPDAAYRKEYEKGWRASHRQGTRYKSPLERLDDRNAPDAAYDGYFDYGAGRPKWHTWHCRLAGGCAEHNYWG